MSAEREELLRLVEDLDETDVHVVLAEVKDRAKTPGVRGQWPPAFFGAGASGRPDIAARVDELLADGFGR